MIKRVCDSCGKEIDINDAMENNFQIEIDNSNNVCSIFSGDLCKTCEKELIDALKKILLKMGIRESEILDDEDNRD